MEYTNNIDPFELGLACILCIGYIMGKVWMYYKVDTHNKETKRRE
jgi:hypothetical protein